MQTDEIYVDQLTVAAIIGLLPAERLTAQPVQVTLTLGLDITEAAVSCSLERTVDYACAVRDVGFILRSAQFRLLETAALALCHYLLAPQPAAVSWVQVSLAKPQALAGVGVPRLSVRRQLAQVQRNADSASGGLIERLFTCAEAALVRLDKCPTSLALPDMARFTQCSELATGADTVLRVYR